MRVGTHDSFVCDTLGFLMADQICHDFPKGIDIERVLIGARELIEDIYCAQRSKCGKVPLPARKKSSEAKYNRSQRTGGIGCKDEVNFS